MSKVAFIGLGVMGAPMAQHMARVHELKVHDVEPQRAASVEGATAESDAAAAVRGAEFVLLSLPTSEIVHEVVLGEDGIIGALDRGAVVVDCSTTSPSISRAIATRLEAAGMGFMDAPVSGGEAAATAGSLAIMVGAREDVFERARAVLEPMATSIVRVGEVGAGGVAKLVNNMIVAATFCVVAETFALAARTGIDHATLYEAIRGGWAGSRVLDVAAPGIIDRDFTPGGTIDILFKDLGYALSLARDENVPVPMTAMADEVFKAARATGRGAYAQQVIIELWERLVE